MGRGMEEKRKKIEKVACRRAVTAKVSELALLLLWSCLLMGFGSVYFMP